MTRIPALLVIAGVLLALEAAYPLALGSAWLSRDARFLAGICVACLGTLLLWVEAREETR